MSVPRRTWKISAVIKAIEKLFQKLFYFIKQQLIFASIKFTKQYWKELFLKYVH